MSTGKDILVQRGIFREIFLWRRVEKSEFELKTENFLEIHKACSCRVDNFCARAKGCEASS